MDTWEIIWLIVCGILFTFLAIATIFEQIQRRKIKKRKPQDHYYLHRKRKDNDNTM